MTTNWQHILAPGDLVLVAASGGGDSTLCALTLAEVAPTIGINVAIAHVNHHMSDAADADEQRVRDLAAKLGLAFHVRHLDDAALQQAPDASTSIEARLRDERLRLLKTIARETSARAIALGHTATERAETFLLMALRGSGPRGLGSMAPVVEVESGLFLIRPLLHLERTEVTDELERCGIEWSDDPLNESPRFRRNRLRKQVFPILRDMEPAAIRVLARSAELCHEQAELLDQLSARELDRCQRIRDPQLIVLDRSTLTELSPPMLRALLRHAWRLLQSSQPGEGADALPPPGVLVEDIARAIHNQDTDTAQFAPAKAIAVLIRRTDILLHHQALALDEALAILLKERQRVILLPKDHREVYGENGVPMINSSQRYTPAEFDVPLPADNGTMHFTIVERADFNRPFDDPAFAENIEAAFDVRTIRKDLYLRAADLSAKLPLGKGISKTVGDILMEAGIPAELRERVATLCDERGVLWIPGVRRPATGYVTDRTAMVLHCKYERLTT